MSVSLGDTSNNGWVFQDVSNRYTRESVDKGILKLLCLFPRTPSLLVLNKMDAIPHSRRVFDLIRKLTCNHLDGQQAAVRFVEETHLRERITAEAYLRAKDNRCFKQTV